MAGGVGGTAVRNPMQGGQYLLGSGQGQRDPNMLPQYQPARRLPWGTAGPSSGWTDEQRQRAQSMQQDAQRQQQFRMARPDLYNRAINSGFSGTPGYVDPAMQAYNQAYQQWNASQGQQPGLTGQNQDPYTTNQYSPTGELIGQQQRQPGQNQHPNTQSYDTSKYDVLRNFWSTGQASLVDKQTGERFIWSPGVGGAPGRYDPDTLSAPSSAQQPGSQYYNPYFGGMNQSPYSSGGLGGLPGGGQYGGPGNVSMGAGQQQQPMQINLGALMQRMSNPQSKTPQGQGPGGQMNQMQQRRQPLRPSYMPNTWEAPQMDYSSGGEA